MKQPAGFELLTEGAAAGRHRAIADAAALSAVRSRGEIRLGFKAVEDGTAIAEGYQGGCLKFRVPRGPRAEVPHAILINTSGGLAGGDALVQSVGWGAGTAAVVTTQAAEKVYRALDQGAVIKTRLTIEPMARAEWMPQETILFDRARLTRDTEARIAGDSEFLGIEAVVLGRTAMDEVMRSGALIDRWRIWRDGRLIYADALKIEGAIDATMQRAALGAGARAMAVIIHVSQHAAALIGKVREALEGAIGMAAASCWNGMLVTRLLARNGAILRHDLLRALSALRGDRAMPRVWSC